MTPELQSKITMWRSRAATGDLSLDEMREALAYLRGERKSAASATSVAKRTKAIKAIPSADDLLSELGDI